jgi:hypothetical protein
VTSDGREWEWLSDKLRREYEVHVQAAVAVSRFALAEGSISRKNAQQTCRSLAITTVSFAKARLKFS